MVTTEKRADHDDDAGHIPAAPGVTIDLADHPGLRRRGGSRAPAPAARRVRQLLGRLRRRPEPGPRQGRGSDQAAIATACADHERGERQVAFVTHRDPGGASCGAPGLVPGPCSAVPSGARSGADTAAHTRKSRQVCRRRSFQGWQQPQRSLPPRHEAAQLAAEAGPLSLPAARVHRDGASSRSTRWSSRSGCRSRTSA